MTERQRATPANAAWIALAGVIIAGGALAVAGEAGADPAVPFPTPAPAGPGGATPAPGQPVLEASDGPGGPPPPPPVGAPPVPEIPNPVYGQGQTPGQLGFFRDMWHTFHGGNPLDALTSPQEEAPGPPPGAGPPPPLPPGFVSLTAPQSSTATMPGVEPGPVPGAEPAPSAPSGPPPIGPVPPTP